MPISIVEKTVITEPIDVTGLKEILALAGLTEIIELTGLRQLTKITLLIYIANWDRKMSDIRGIAKAMELTSITGLHCITLHLTYFFLQELMRLTEVPLKKTNSRLIAARFHGADNLDMYKHPR